MSEQSVIPFPLQSRPAFAVDHLRAVEAVLFASAEPVAIEQLALRLPAGTDCAAILRELQAVYAGRGVHLVEVAGKWAFRTAPDLAYLMTAEVVEPRKLSRAALETLAIIAYHQPVTRAEVEEIRGVSLGKGTLDLLIEIGWVRLRGRRKAPGRPVTYGTTEAFLVHFGLNEIGDLPGVEELVGAGLLDKSSVGAGRAGEDAPDDPGDDEFLDDDAATFDTDTDDRL
ncbi:MAG: SMC-Scp complex subunit ScpB [Bauldia sp.]|nr:SMC-Scp complex subunit ScpB [Bauldia sp.]